MVETDQVAVPAPEEEDPRPLLFISHRHQDHAIADVIRNFVVTRSGGRVNVFQSSAAGAEAPRIGKNLNQELVRNLWRASIVILVYTRQDQNLSYCMWECGVATHPDSPDTKIIVFHSGGQVPPLFAEQVHVDVRSAVSVTRFTSEFLTSKDFFPRYGQPIAPGFHSDDANVEAAANELLAKLEEVWPEVDERVEEWPAYPYLRLELSRDQIRQICAQEPGRRLAATAEIVSDAVIVESDAECARVFGMVSIQPGSKLGSLIDTWKHEYGNGQPNWLIGLASQVMDGAQWRFPTLRWELMRSMDRNDGTWYGPVVNRVRRLDGGESMQFDVYFDKFSCDEATSTVRVGLPQH
jgi:hypothetical protein